MEPLANLRTLDDFDSLMVKLASPEEIRKWSRGEVTKPETINYRTLKAEKDGLFDERIFGPLKDWECYCGKYKRIRYKGVVCDKCGVEVTQSRVRRERMGHISLASPVAHVWFFKGAPSKISLLLDVSPRAVEHVIYFSRYLVLSIDKKGKKEAVNKLRKSKKDRLQEIADYYAERQETITKEAQENRTKTEKRIKNKEQLNLALQEIELNLRKKKQALSTDEEESQDKATKIFDNLISTIRSLEVFSIMTEEEYAELTNYEAADFFEAEMGSEAVLKAVEKVDIDKLAAETRAEIEEAKTGSARFVKAAKRLRVIDGFRKAKVDPNWMILRVLPVLPPDLRPMVQLSGGRFAASDINDLYRRVINRNNRLKHLMNLGAPEIILRNEKRMLQESVDSLLDGYHKKATRRGRGKQPLRSLSDMLKGKQGRFRQNLLGKRVDYSGRSVIIVGPKLKLNQCGIPKDMALEMFKPFVLHEMIKRGIAPNVKSAKNMLERKPSSVFDILEEITKDHPVLLNRAPTLHKLSIQAFYPVLIDGSAIRLHPAICKGFNADFDGDQMAVHVPLSKKARQEAIDSMLPQENLLRPSDGSPVSTPASKEMALGVYYLTSIDPRIKPSDDVFSDSTEAMRAHDTGQIELRQLINVRIGDAIIETTIGRIMLNEALPAGFEFVNKSADSDVVKDIFSKAYDTQDKETVVEMIDKIKDLGFYGGTISGVSFGVFDAKTSDDKERMLKEAEAKVTEIESNYEQGLLTNEERKRNSMEVWLEVTEELADITWELLDPTNPIKIVVDAKAGRASKDQVKQLAAIRGLVVDPLGKIVEMPIKSNFREGLNTFEYVTSGRGSRKGLTDTALKTADAGYLTRRLVDVAHDLIIRMEDCGAQDGFVIDKTSRANYFEKRIVGRVLAKDAEKDGVVIAKKGELLTAELVKKLSEKIDSVEVRSPLTCKARYGLCAVCYGTDLSDNKIVKIGVPVGVVAAQSIGEPGTQLTLRTKHAAGVVGVDVTQGLPRVEELFEARTPKVLSPLSEIAGKVTLGEVEEGWKVRVTSVNTKPKEEREYIVPKAINLAVDDGQLVDVGTKLAAASLDIKEVLSVRGLREAQKYLVDEIQAVYESQGIGISDKHFEVIVRKMSDEVSVLTPGDTDLLPGEYLDRASFEEENEKVLAAGGEPASAEQIVLGITRRSLFTASWLSAASFEQTTDVLTQSAILGSEDPLLGLKENVVIGRLIPVAPEAASLPVTTLSV